MQSQQLIRRRRPMVSCVVCRQRKVKCNRVDPCSNCVRRKTACVYDQRARAAEDVVPAQSTSSDAPTSYATPSRSHVTASTRQTTPLTDAAQPLRTQSKGSEQPSIETITSRVGGSIHVHYDASVARGLSHKTRTFGQSNWVVSVAIMVRDIFETVDNRMDEFAHTWSGLEQCKSLARVIKARRAPAWPTPPTSDLPSRQVADALVAQYMLTTESIYRILHLPSFQRDYEGLFEGKADTSFLIQANLVFALGAATYDDTFSLRTSAVRWVYEARTWMAEPKFKSRLDLSSLQTSLLLVLAQERIVAGGETMWISMGSIVRRAMFMGLHRDPAHLPPRDALEAEMRRRIWNTILEFALQSSLQAGGAPLITANDFDAACPGNCNDSQMTETEGEERYTQTSVAVALRKTWPQRLAAVKLLNDLSSTQDYEETLAVDARLRAAFKDLTRTLQSYALSEFETQAVDLLMHRYLLCLHVPYATQNETRHAYSRKVVVESALKAWRTLGLSAPCVTLRRLSLCSAGFYTVAAYHAALLIAMELRLQLREDEGLGPTPLRPDLLAVADESITWCLQALRAGETNVKGYMLMSVLTTQIDATRRGLAKEETATALLRAVDDVQKTSLPILEAAAEAMRGDEMDADWEFMMSDSLFMPDSWDGLFDSVDVA